MLKTKRIWLSILTAVLMAAMVSPALAFVTANASLPQSGEMSPEAAVDVLRHRVSQTELISDYEQAADWLGKWMAQREHRPPVDPARQSQTTAQWTVMIHVAADNNLEVAGLWDVNEMEGIGSSPDVNIVVQIDRSSDYVDIDGDWTETRRYYIQQDDDPNVITSPVVESLGETNTGDPNSVADFAIWGITNYPAEIYAGTVGSWRRVDQPFQR
jgi:hypothetical protein